MYICDFCEEKTELIVEFIESISPITPGRTVLKLCFSCFEQNTEKKITDLERIFCMFCGEKCWDHGNTPLCAVEVIHKFVQYRVCKKCWKEQGG